MHPYRDLYVCDPAPAPVRDDGARLAYIVMTVVGSIPLLVPGVPLLQTLFGGACALVGAGLLVRNRRATSR